MTSTCCSRIALIAVTLAAVSAAVSPRAAHGSTPVAAAAACCWCDGDTPDAFRVTVDADGQEHELVFSDEFSQPGRNFSNGADKRWTAIDKSDYTNASPVRYTPEAITTVLDRGAMVLANASDPGSERRVFRPYRTPYSALRIETRRITDKAVAKAVNKTFQGGMLQSWDKFCFTGGVVEVSAKFPMGLGFWPALWLFGNLGRAIHEESNDGLWPYSLEECDPVYEQRPVAKPGKKQRISGCDPAPPSGLHPRMGRGATEIDLVEVGDSWNGQAGWLMQSLQLAPSIPDHFRPKLHDPPIGYTPNPRTGQVAWVPPTHGASTRDTWYRRLRFGGNTSGVPAVLPNAHWYGPKFADSLTAGISPFHDLSERYRTFRLEWREGDGGYLRWLIDGVFIFEIPAAALDKYTVCAQTPDDGAPVCETTPRRKLPSEPMSIVINTALGSWNGGPDATNGHMPGEMLVDFVRVWQSRERTNVGCDPPDYPTRRYIDEHAHLYGTPARPRGYDSCPQIYPHGTRGADGDDAGARAAGARRPLGGALAIGLAAVAAGALVALFGGSAVVRSLLRKRAAARQRPSQYGEVGDPAGASREPMLR